jgi:hypothetical protein
MTVEIGTETAQFPEKEYINGIFVAMCVRIIYNREHRFLKNLVLANTARNSFSGNLFQIFGIGSLQCRNHRVCNHYNTSQSHKVLRKKPTLG